MFSRDDKPEKVDHSGWGVLWSYFTHLVLHSIFILTSRLRCLLLYGSELEDFPSGNMSKVTLRFFISLFKSSRHKVFPFSSSRSYASWTVDGSWTPYLWDNIFVLSFTAEIILSLLLRLNGTHHKKSGSISIPLDDENSDTSTGLDFFKLFKGIHWSVTFFHWTNKFHHKVFFGCNSDQI